MWMPIRLWICHILWLWLFICHCKNEKIEAQFKGSSDHSQNTVENLKGPANLQNDPITGGRHRETLKLYIELHWVHKMIIEARSKWCLEVLQRVPPAWQSEDLQTSLLIFKVVNHILWIRIRLLICESYFVNIFFLRLLWPLEMCQEPYIVLTSLENSILPTTCKVFF